MTAVMPFGVTTTVSAERFAMTGDETVFDIATVWLVRLEISGATIISTILLEVMNGVTRRMMPTLSYWIVLIVWPSSVIRLFVTNGTSCPTTITASWLFRAMIEGRERISTFPLVANARIVAC